MIDFSDYIWKYCPEIGWSTGAYTIFYQGGAIYHGPHVPGSVSQSSAESEYNAACTAGMALAYFGMLINELLNKDKDIVPEASPIIILYIKYTVFIYKNGKDTNNTTHISRRVHFLINGENCKMHNILWCERGL